MAVIVALGLVVVVLLIVEGRDKSTFTGSTARATGTQTPDQGDAHRRPPPGFRYATDPPTSGPHLPVPVRHDGGPLSEDELLRALELGDVVLVYGDRSLEAGLRGVVDDATGPFDAVLAARGQAVLLDHSPGTAGVIALSWRRMLRVANASDPRLAAFVDARLGHGAAGATSP